MIRVAVLLGLLLSACSADRPQFHVGDCITGKIPPERWEKPVIERIEEIGVQAYRIRYYSDDGSLLAGSHTRAFVLDDFDKSVPCPKGE